jgi:glycosyltransferase involved in cell wall biosynthesis
MPKVAYLTDSLESGGAERQLLLLASAIRQTNWQAQVVRYRPDAFFQIPEGVEDHLLPRRGRFDPTLWRTLARTLRRDRVDLVHTWKAFSALYAGALGLGPGRVPHLMHFHNGAGFCARFPAYARAYLGSALLADHVVGVAQDALDWLAELGLPRDRLLFLPNCVAPELIEAPATAPAAQAALLERLGLPAHGPAPIVTMCRISSNKNPAGIVRALGLLRQRGHAVPPLLALGRVTEPAELQRCQLSAAARGVTFVHHAPIHEVAALLDAAGVVVLAGHTEGLPMVLIEAMTRRALAVAAATGEVADILRDGETGFVVPQRHGETPDDALADAIARALALSPAARAEVGDAARTAALAGFHPEVLARRWAALYDQLLRERRGPIALDPRARPHLAGALRELRLPARVRQRLAAAAG